MTFTENIQWHGLCIALLLIGSTEILSSVCAQELKSEGVAEPSESLDISDPSLQTPINSSADVKVEARYLLSLDEASDDVDPSDALEEDVADPDSREVGAEEKPKALELYLGTRNPNPTTLRGITRSTVTPASSNVRGNLSLSGGVQWNISDRDQLRLEVRGGDSVLGGDLSYFSGTEDPRKGLGVNIATQRSLSSHFSGGEIEVDLPSGDSPKVHRFGGGVEWLQPIGKIDTAWGVNYQNVSVRDGLLSGDRQPVDELGNPLTFGPDGEDDLLTFNVAAQYDTRDDAKNPSQGTRIRAGLDQSIPLGGANDIALTRVHASATQFIPVKFFGFTKGPRTVVLNVQGGHIFGDLPPYEAFSLGGASTVRGYGLGEVGSGRSFMQASAEYRFPITALRVLKRDLDIGGTLFTDFGSLLGSQDNVIGTPGIVRDKPGEGFGYGVGLRASTEDLLARFELALNDDADFEVHLTIGERF